MAWNEDDVPQMLAILSGVSVKDWELVGLLTVESSPIVLMHAANSGSEGTVVPPGIDEASVIDIITRDVAPGIYEIRTKEMNFPDKEEGGSYVWHSFTRLP